VCCSVLRETIREDCELPLAVNCVPARRNTMHGAHNLDAFLASRYKLPYTIGGKSLLYDHCRQHKHKCVANDCGVSVGFAPGYCEQQVNYEELRKNSSVTASELITSKNPHREIECFLSKASRGQVQMLTSTQKKGAGCHADA